MVAHAVTRAWQKSLASPPVEGRVDQPKSDLEKRSPATHGWHRRDAANAVIQAPADLDIKATDLDTKNDIRDDDPPIRVGKRDHIIPRRAAVSIVEQPAESLWSSREFWMGLVFGAAIVLVIKTVLAVQAPFGINWY